MKRIEKEITEQPRVIKNLIHGQWSQAQAIAKAIRDFDPAFMLISARGTSDNAGRYGQYLMEIQTGLPVGLATPSVNTIYERKPRLRNALVVGLSQSGYAEDVLRVLTDARTGGALTVSVTNNPNSPLALASHCHLELMAGEETSIAATKTYTAQLTAFAMIATALVDQQIQIEEVRKLPEYVASTLKLSENILTWVERYRYIDECAVIGRGYNYSTAFEISLKLKELCYISCQEYSEADFQHGPIALIDQGFPVIVVSPKSKPLPRLINLLEDLHKRQAECLVISNDEAAHQFALQYMPLPNMPEWLTPITAVIPGQIFAAHLSIAKGYNVDSPRGLSKITVTH